MVNPRNRPDYLDEQESLGFVHGSLRWRSHDGKRLFTWDAQHGEIEAFNRRGDHLGAVDPQTGAWIKDPVKGRRIDV